MTKLGLISLLLGGGSLVLSLVQGVVQEKEQNETIKEEVSKQVQEEVSKQVQEALNPTEGEES